MTYKLSFHLSSISFSSGDVTLFSLGNRPLFHPPAPDTCKELAPCLALELGMALNPGQLAKLHLPTIGIGCEVSM